MEKTMRGAYLPGNSTVELREVPVPTPGHGEVLLRMKASTICGSDIRCIYHEHLGRGPEGYQGVIAGHEPAGQIVEVGPGCRRFKEGDRVIVYHISGCGVCNDCRRGYMISCTSERYRRAYGWQRDGGMADYLIAEEKDLIALPDDLSYADGAQVACGFGTVYEGLEKIGISGSAKGAAGWFKVTDGSVYFDHPVHAPADHSLNIDVLNPSRGPSARVALELDPGSARALAHAILETLESVPESLLVDIR